GGSLSERRLDSLQQWREFVTLSGAHPAELVFRVSPTLPDEPLRVESPRVRGFGSVYRSVVTVVGIGVCVGWIVRTTKAVVVIAAASEAVPSAAEATVADVRDATCAQAADAAGAKATHA